MKFLVNENDSELVFLTFDSSVCAMWSFKANSDIEFKHIEKNSAEFTSAYYTAGHATIFWTCSWNRHRTISTLDKWDLNMNQKHFTLNKSFNIQSRFPIKACILGAGLRFAVVICACNHENLHIIDTVNHNTIASLPVPGVNR